MKLKLSLSFILAFLSLITYSQKLSVAGNIQDTIAKEPLRNAVIMAVRLTDSTLTDFTRTDDKGLFNLDKLPVDTYQVIISHPKFADQVYFIFGDPKNLKYDFGKIILQPKNVSLDEVTIFAYKEPVYYKGDTLVYNADSFKTKPNATVEDLLKKLPGMKVDADGKITAQGKKVDKVLVDGDEFFGSDPTIATKNLNANAIESVQVYDKKSDDAANTTTGEETQKILNLKLKDEAKKGYFGKISGASDFQKFYEGELLGNYFKKKLKVSVFGLASNTPKSGFGWGDMYKYGLDNEFNRNTNEDGDTYFYTTSQNQGIPQTFKSGFYYSDRLSKNTKLNINYTYNNSEVLAKSTTNSQYFLTDTSYTTANASRSLQRNEAHSINIGLEQKIDSLTDLNFTSKIKFLNNRNSSTDETDFISSNNLKTRNTTINNNVKGDGYDIANNLKLTRKFMKKDRLLILTYSNVLSHNQSEGILKTDNYSYTDSTEILNSIDQKKNNLVNNQNHNAGIAYTEPLSSKLKVEVSYDYMYYNTQQDKLSLNSFGGEYSLVDSSLTNKFTNIKQVNRAGLKFIFENKKLRYTLGSKARNIFVNNNNLFTQQRITQNVNNLLPFSTMRYKFTESDVINISYYTSSQNPTISQLQPIRDNTNPNFINIGNPDLLPTFDHHLDLNFNSWKSVSGKYTWIGINSSYTNNDISNSTYYDSIGRTVTKPVNVNGNYQISGYAGTSWPLFSKKLSLEPNAWGSYSSTKTYINNFENITKDLRSNLSLNLRLDLEVFTANVNGYIELNSSSSSLNTKSNKPYTTQGLSGNIMAKFPKKFMLETDATYTINSKRSNGYNINYLVWNATLSKLFLKNENLIIALCAYDILKQNINVNRNITANVITDTKTNVITQYFLLKATFKFNSNKTKEENDF